MKPSTLTFAHQKATGMVFRALLVALTLAGGLIEAPLAAATGVAGPVVPGATLRVWNTNTTHDSICTAGFLARNSRGAPVLLDAGHCDQGGPVTMSDANGQQVPVAGFVVSTFDGAENDDTDIAALQISKGITAQPDIGGAIPVAGWTSAVAPGDVLCKIGATSGRSCGHVVSVSPSKVKFTAAIEPGDSGGPVYAMNPDGTALAVGITIRKATDDGDAVAELIGPWMRRWSLTIG